MRTFSGDPLSARNITVITRVRKRWAIYRRVAYTSIRCGRPRSLQAECRSANNALQTKSTAYYRRTELLPGRVWVSVRFGFSARSSERHEPDRRRPVACTAGWIGPSLFALGRKNGRYQPSAAGRPRIRRDERIRTRFKGSVERLER